jgi:hypothetical protein
MFLFSCGRRDPPLAVSTFIVGTQKIKEAFVNVFFVCCCLLLVLFVVFVFVVFLYFVFLFCFFVVGVFVGLVLVCLWCCLFLCCCCCVVLSFVLGGGGLCRVLLRWKGLRALASESQHVLAPALTLMLHRVAVSVCVCVCECVWVTHIARAYLKLAEAI